MVQVATEIAEPIVTFYCQDATYPVVARSSSSSFPDSAKQGINTGLLSFQIKNDSSQDLPSCVINLEDNYAWNIIKPNDYVKIDMQYRSDTFDSPGVHYTCLFAGLVSEVRETIDGKSNTRMYTVTVQGLAKILQNVQLSTFEEATQHFAYALLPNDEKKGIQFTGRSSAGIIYQILKKFILGDAIDNTQINKLSIQSLQKDNQNDKNKDKKDDDNPNRVQTLLYNFNTGNQDLGVKDLIHVDIVENKDETYTIADGDSADKSITKYSNYNGSLLSMIKEVASVPFNELFWTHEEGRATLHYRPTPFDEENWFSLPCITVDSNAVLAQEIANSDQDQCAVFKLTAEEQAASSSMDAYLYPVTNLKLIERYGYKKMAVANDYFSGGQDHKDTKGVGGTSQADKGVNQVMGMRRPPYSQMKFIFDTVANGKFSSSEVFIPSELGGVELYDSVKNLLESVSDRETFINRCISLNPSVINRDKATQIYNDDHNNNTSNKNVITASRYLYDIAPNVAPVSASVIKSKGAHMTSIANVKKHPKYCAQELMNILNYNIGSKQAYDICKAVGNGTFSNATYNQIMSQDKYSDVEDGVGATGGDNSSSKVTQLMIEYTRKLFNWYADNSKYYSGTITINGTNGIEIGKRLLIHSDKDGLYYEFYIESVSHSFSFQQGWTTTVGVTRGLPLPSPNKDDIQSYRFMPPHSFTGLDEPFTGGYFGEESLKDAINDAKAKEDTSGSGGASSSGKGGSCNGKNGQVIGHWDVNSVPSDVKKAIDDSCILSPSDLKSDTTFYGTALQGQCTHYSHCYVSKKAPGKASAAAGNGGEVAGYYISHGVAEKVGKPTVGAIFSADNGHLWAVGSAGHTGVVCGVMDDGSFLCAQCNVPPHRATDIGVSITKIDGVPENASWVRFAKLK